MKNLTLALVLVFSLAAQAARIAPESTLFGLEATFQDQGMVDEPGRMTMETEHKTAKFRAMVDSFKKLMGSQSEEKPYMQPGFKPGVQFDIEGYGHVIANMEPVCVEWNVEPQRLFEIEKKWTPIYEAAKSAGLVPYVNPAAERSGMGHIHIGGRTLGESPFFAHPLLLRNILVYTHQHPSTLWGFAEAFDIGNNSNIETYHINGRQEKFKKAVTEFDGWWEGANLQERKLGGFQFLRILYKNGGDDFFEHYRWINLEHLRAFARMPLEQAQTYLQKPGKYTVEFRNIRPYKSPQHAFAMAEYLNLMMEKLSAPDELVPFKMISDDAYEKFHSRAVVESDWDIVRHDLNAENPLLGDMIREYVMNPSLTEKRLADGTIVQNTYSEKNDKGQEIEVLVPHFSGVIYQTLRNQGHTFTRAKYDGKGYFVTVIAKSDYDRLEAKIKPLKNIPWQKPAPAAPFCRAVRAS